MTTSETTALLPRADAHLSPSWRQRAEVIAFGPIQWPWLLRGLHGGRKADKRALLARVGLPADALFDRLAPGGMILLDDAARPGERIVGKRWRERWPEIDFILDSSGAKGTLIGRRHG